MSFSSSTFGVLRSKAIHIVPWHVSKDQSFFACFPPLICFKEYACFISISHDSTPIRSSRSGFRYTVVTVWTIASLFNPYLYHGSACFAIISLAPLLSVRYSRMGLAKQGPGVVNLHWGYWFVVCSALTECSYFLLLLHFPPEPRYRRALIL